jgi:hypothetical protein
MAEPSRLEHRLNQLLIIMIIVEQVMCSENATLLPPIAIKRHGDATQLTKRRTLPVLVSTPSELELELLGPLSRLDLYSLTPLPIVRVPHTGIRTKYTSEDALAVRSSQSCTRMAPKRAASCCLSILA